MRFKYDLALLLYNNLLHFAVSDPWLKLSFGLCAVCTALSIAVTEMQREELLLLYPLALALPHVVVGHRAPLRNNAFVDVQSIPQISGSSNRIRADYALRRGGALHRYRVSDQ